MIDRKLYKEYINLPEVSDAPPVESLLHSGTVKFRKKLTAATAAALALAVFLLSDAAVYASSGVSLTQKAISFFKSIGNGNMTADIQVKENAIKVVTYLCNSSCGYSVVEGSRTYFVFENIKKDITDIIAGGNYYLYEYTEENGILHRIYVGEGTWRLVDNERTYLSGFAEELFLSNDSFVRVFSDYSGEEPAWRQKVRDDYPLYR